MSTGPSRLYMSRHSTTIRPPTGRTDSNASRIPARTAGPSQNGRMRQFNATLPHHFDQIACTQFVTEVPPDTVDDNLLVEMPLFEEVRVRRHFTPLWQRCPGASGFAPEPSK